MSERLALPDFVSLLSQPLLLLLELGDRRYRTLSVAVSRNCSQLKLGVLQSVRLLSGSPGPLRYCFLQLVLLQLKLLGHPLGFRLFIDANKALELCLELPFPHESRQLEKTLANGSLSHHRFMLLCSLDLDQLQIDQFLWRDAVFFSFLESWMANISLGFALYRW